MTQNYVTAWVDAFGLSWLGAIQGDRNMLGLPIWDSTYKSLVVVPATPFQPSKTEYRANGGSVSYSSSPRPSHALYSCSSSVTSASNSSSFESLLKGIFFLYATILMLTVILRSLYLSHRYYTRKALEAHRTRWREMESALRAEIRNLNKDHFDLQDAYHQRIQKESNHYTVWAEKERTLRAEIENLQVENTKMHDSLDHSINENISLQTQWSEKQQTLSAIISRLQLEKKNMQNDFKDRLSEAVNLQTTSTRDRDLPVLVQQALDVIMRTDAKMDWVRVVTNLDNVNKQLAEQDSGVAYLSARYDDDDGSNASSEVNNITPKGPVQASFASSSSNNELGADNIKLKEKLNRPKTVTSNLSPPLKTAMASTIQAQHLIPAKPPKPAWFTLKADTAPNATSHCKKMDSVAAVPGRKVGTIHPPYTTIPGLFPTYQALSTSPSRIPSLTKPIHGLPARPPKAADTMLGATSGVKSTQPASNSAAPLIPTPSLSTDTATRSEEKHDAAAASGDKSTNEKENSSEEPGKPDNEDEEDEKPPTPSEENKHATTSQTPINIDDENKHDAAAESGVRKCR